MRRTSIVGKALVLGADSRSGLSTIRSLGRGGVEIHAASHRYDAITARSRYLRKYDIVPAYSEGSQDWKTALTEVIAREHFDLILPTNDMWTTALQRCRADFAHAENLYVMSDDAFDILFDKVKTSQLARSLSIPVPDEILISRDDQLADALSVREFPVVLKPIRSLDERDGGPRRVVCQASSQADMIRQASAMLDAGPITVQRYVAGHGVGVELLMHNGEPLLMFQHERLHEAFGSGSSYRKGVPLSPQLVDASLRLLRHIRYTGVAMVEFRVNPETREWVLLEVNARFWGSLPLALAAGADFPLALYNLLTRGETDIAQTHHDGIHSRNLSMDLPWYRETYAAGRHSPAATMGLLVDDVLRTASNVARRREKIDTLALDDPAPFLAELAHLTATYRGRLAARLARRWPGAIKGAPTSQ